MLDKKNIRSALGKMPCADAKQRKCSGGCGELPQTAPLANAFVPFQSNSPEQYPIEKGLIRGTLFPGLDLPYLGMVNTQEKGDHGLAELQALAFAMNELALYLDTHPDDRDAAALFESYAALYRDGVARYQCEHGPLYRISSVADGEYRWTKGPWPWEICANKEG